MKDYDKLNLICEDCKKKFVHFCRVFNYGKRRFCDDCTQKRKVALARERWKLKKNEKTSNRLGG